MYAAINQSAQCPALVKLVLKAKGDVNAADSVSAWEGDGVGCHIRGVRGKNLCRG